MTQVEETKRRSTPDEMKDRIDKLQKRHQTVIEKRASLNGQIQAKKQELSAIIKEIEAAGYDPKNIAADYDKAETDLNAILVDFEKKLSEVETALAVFEKDTVKK